MGITAASSSSSSSSSNSLGGEDSDGTSSTHGGGVGSDETGGDTSGGGVTRQKKKRRLMRQSFAEQEQADRTIQLEGSHIKITDVTEMYKQPKSSKDQWKFYNYTPDRVGRPQ